MGVDRYRGGGGNKRAPRRGMRLGMSMYTMSEKHQGQANTNVGVPTCNLCMPNNANKKTMHEPATRNANKKTTHEPATRVTI